MLVGMPVGTPIGTPIALWDPRHSDACLARPMNISTVSAPRLLTVEPGANRLLGALPAADLQRWRPHLELVGLPAGTALSRVGEVPCHVYFPTTASVSLMHTTRDGDSLEILAVGQEGMVGLHAIMGGGAATEGAVVRLGGHGFRVSQAWLRSEFHDSDAVMGLVLRYAQTVLTHTAQSAVCNTHHSLEQRLCRCLLSSFDHGHGAPMNLTHECLSCMLGVRREGVTGAALKLQRAGVIHYARGRVAVVDRPSLEARSCECYRLVKSVYERLLPGSSPFTRLSRPMDMPAAPAAAAWSPGAHLAGPSRAQAPAPSQRSAQAR